MRRRLVKAQLPKLALVKRSWPVRRKRVGKISRPVAKKRFCFYAAPAYFTRFIYGQNDLARQRDAKQTAGAVKKRNEKQTNDKTKQCRRAARFQTALPIAADVSGVDGKDQKQS